MADSSMSRSAQNATGGAGGEEVPGGSGEALRTPLGDARWKVACINWSHDDAPHACAYLSVNGAAGFDRYFATWSEAIEWADKTARRFAR